MTRAVKWNPLRWGRRAQVIATAGSAMAIALAVSLALTLTGGSPAAKPDQPMTFARGPVLIVLAAVR